MTPSEIDAAIGSAWTAYLRTFCYAPGAQWRDDATFFWYTTSIPGESSVMRANLAPGEVAQAIAELRATFAAQGQRLDWLVGPDSSPADLGNQLLAQGFCSWGAARTMAADLTAAIHTPEIPGLEIQLVRDVVQLKAWIAAERDGFEQSPIQADAYSALRRAVPIGPNQPWQRYLGLLDGHPVCSTTLMLDGNACGIFDVATAPAARRKGIASALVAHVMRVARERGCVLATLQPSEAGASLYTQLGFREATPWMVYADMANGAD
jgi:GNAT superfamily N-acetyltransferase